MSQFTTNRLQASSFTTIQTPAGSSPTAGSPNDVLTLTSSDSSVNITGNAITDTIDFTVNPASVGIAFNEVANDAGSNPQAVLGSQTLNLVCTTPTDYFFTGNNATNTSTLTINTATSTQTGLLSSTDWATFNNKVDYITSVVNALIFG